MFEIIGKITVGIICILLVFLMAFGLTELCDWANKQENKAITESTKVINSGKIVKLVHFRKPIPERCSDYAYHHTLVEMSNGHKYTLVGEYDFPTNIDGKLMWSKQGTWFQPE